MANFSMKIVPFTVPSEVCLQIPPRPRQEGIKELPKIGIGDLDPHTLSDLCDEFRQQVFANAGKEDPKLPPKRP